MQNSVFVCVVHSAGYLYDYLRRLRDRYRRVLHYFVKLTALDEIHAEVAETLALSDFMNRNDKWVVEVGGGFRFPSKTL